MGKRWFSYCQGIRLQGSFACHILKAIGLPPAMDYWISYYTGVSGKTKTCFNKPTLDVWLFLPLSYAEATAMEEQSHLISEYGRLSAPGTHVYYSAWLAFYMAGQAYWKYQNIII